MLIYPMMLIVLFIGFAFGVIMSLGYEVYKHKYIPPTPPSDSLDDFDAKVNFWFDFYYKE